MRDNFHVFKSHLGTMAAAFTWPSLLVVNKNETKAVNPLGLKLKPKKYFDLPG